jgi:hypothetical protein
MQVEGPAGDSRAFGYRSHRQRLESFFFQERAHRGQQRRPGALAASIAWLITGFHWLISQSELEENFTACVL